MAQVIWQGAIKTDTYRVVDNGAGTSPRLLVELQQQPDAMGGRGWGRFDPIPRDVFEALLVLSGVVK